MLHEVGEVLDGDALWDKADEHDGGPHDPTFDNLENIFKGGYRGSLQRIPPLASRPAHRHCRAVAPAPLHCGFGILKFFSRLIKWRKRGPIVTSP